MSFLFCTCSLPCLASPWALCFVPWASQSHVLAWIRWHLMDVVVSKGQWFFCLLICYMRSGRQRLVTGGLGHQRYSFQLLPTYRDAVEARCPGAVVDLQVDPVTGEPLSYCSTATDYLQATFNAALCALHSSPSSPAAALSLLMEPSSLEGSSWSSPHCWYWCQRPQHHTGLSGGGEWELLFLGVLPSPPEAGGTRSLLRMSGLHLWLRQGADGGRWGAWSSCGSSPLLPPPEGELCGEVLETSCRAFLEGCLCSNPSPVWVLDGKIGTVNPDAEVYLWAIVTAPLPPLSCPLLSPANCGTRPQTVGHRSLPRHSVWALDQQHCWVYQPGA